MEKLSIKLVLVAFLIFSLGLQAITEARDLRIPCQTDADCGNPKCICNLDGLCVCNKSQLFEDTMTKTPKVRKEVP
ncbi:hypothetical protein SLE2022_060660 [Rubroshorea leprosula]